MSTQTANLGLHQWEATDHFRRTEFNEDFAKIDAAVAGKAAASALACEKVLSYVNQSTSATNLSIPLTGVDWTRYSRIEITLSEGGSTNVPIYLFFNGYNTSGDYARGNSNYDYFAYVYAGASTTLVTVYGLGTTLSGWSQAFGKSTQNSQQLMQMKESIGVTFRNLSSLGLKLVNTSGAPAALPQGLTVTICGYPK